MGWETLYLDLSVSKGDKLPTEEDPKPVVDCTFFTDFENHIYVTTDAEAFFFLHDIISSYVKEKERVLSIQQARKSTIHHHRMNLFTDLSDIEFDR